MVAYDHMRLSLSDLEWAYKYADTMAKAIDRSKY